MSASIRAAGRSTLNPYAPVFIPMALRQVEDFSPEWSELDKTATWFPEQLFRCSHGQVQKTSDVQEEVDIASLLPDSIDLGIGDELSVLTPELPFCPEPNSMASKERIRCGFLNDAEEAGSLCFQSPKNGLISILEASKYNEKHVHRLNPYSSSHHFIQQLH